jgi:hypothetical protein
LKLNSVNLIRQTASCDQPHHHGKSVLVIVLRICGICMSDAETFILRRLGPIRKLNKANWTVLSIDEMESHPVDQDT